MTAIRGFRHFFYLGTERIGSWLLYTRVHPYLCVALRMCACAREPNACYKRNLCCAFGRAATVGLHSTREFSSHFVFISIGNNNPIIPNLRRTYDFICEHRLLFFKPAENIKLHFNLCLHLTFIISYLSAISFAST
jgi:hypothetical protein